MFCEKCGSQIPEGSAFCPNCGNPVKPAAVPARTETEVTATTSVEVTTQIETNTVAEPAPAETPAGNEAPQPQAPAAEPVAPAPRPQYQENPYGAQQPYPQQPYVPQPGVWQQPAPKKGSGKVLAIILGIVGLFLVLICVLVFFLTRPKTYNLEDYVTIEYSGYDGHATARAYLNIGDLEEDILEAKYKGKGVDDIWGYTKALSYAAQLESLLYDVDVDLEGGYDELSNGDELVAKISYDNKDAKKLKIRFTGDSVTETVEGLEAIREVDPFEDLEVSFEGTAPDGYMTYNYTGDLPYAYFTYDNSSNLSNGDIVTFTFGVDNDTTERAGYYVTRREQTYEVHGLLEYADSFEDLDPVIDQMKKDATDKITAYISSSYSSDVSTSPLKYSGYVFFSKYADAETWGDQNVLYLIYETTLSHNENLFEETEVYFPVQFSRILMSEDGSHALEYYYSDIQGYSTIEIPDSWDYYNTYGYLDPVQCYIELTRGEEENYSIENGGDFAKYAEYKLITSVFLNEEARAGIQEEARAYIETLYAEPDPYYKDELVDLELTAEIVLVRKDENSNYAPNVYYPIFAATLHSGTKRHEDKLIYLPVEMQSVYITDDGEYSIGKIAGIAGAGMAEIDENHTVDGYVDSDVLVDELVEANIDDYDYDFDGELWIGEGER